MILPLSFPKFLAAWTPLAVAAVAVDPAPRLSEVLVVSIGGYPVPVVTCALGAIGVIAARPLARKTESALSPAMFWLVSAIMLALVELWVLEMRPGVLFTFTIGLGLGFSGFSLIELFGAELKELISARFRAIGAAFGGQTQDTPEDGDRQ